MAGDWIKMRSNLWDDPRVARLCDITDQSEAAIIGGLYWLWSAADQHTESGEMFGLSLRQIDRKTAIQGFGDALIDIGWIDQIDGGIRVVRFDEHNGSSAKRRIMEAKRKADVRNASASDADKSRTNHGQHAELEIELEKDLEKENSKHIGARAPADKSAKVSVTAKDLVNDYGISQQHAAEWLEVRKAKRAKLTKTAMDAMIREAGKAGLSLQDAVMMCVERSWAGFKAEYVGGKEPPKPQASSGGFATQDYSEGLDEHGNVL